MKPETSRFKTLFQQIRKSEFSKNSIALLGGTVFSQLIPIGLSPVLTRLFSPTEFGVLALFVSISKIISVFITGRYEPAIVLPKEDRDGVNLMGAAFFLSFGFLIALTLVSIFFQAPIADLLNAPGIESWLIWIPLTAFLMAGIQILSQWLLRVKRFKALSSGKITQAVGTGAVQVSAFSGALVIGNITGQIVAFFYYLKVSYKSVRPLVTDLSKEQMWKNMKHYKNFPLVTSLHRFFDLLQSNVLISMISSLFSAAVLGFYSLTTRTLLAPAALIGSAVGNVFYQKAAQYHQNQVKIVPLAQKVVAALFGIGLAGFSILFFTADFIFETVFGAEWVECALYTKILMPWLFLNFISAPVSGLVNILGAQRLFFLISALGNTVAVASFVWVGWYTEEIELSLMVFSGLMSIYMLVYLLAIFGSLKQFDSTCK